MLWVKGMSNFTFNLTNDSIIANMFGKVQECCPCDPAIMQGLNDKWNFALFLLAFVVLIWTYDVVINRGGWKKFLKDTRQEMKKDDRRNRTN